MADERCVFPGGVSRPPGGWLDRDAAERLLSGQPLETVDAGVRDEADRLVETLGVLRAVTDGTPVTSTELPGEAAALAAFRNARTRRTGEEASLAPHTRTHSSPPSPSPDRSLDAGLVRLGRAAADRRTAFPRWIRPVRHGLAAALAAGMIGGVAVAATAGVLAVGGDEAEPGAPATVAVTPDRLLDAPSPGGSRRGPDEPGPGSSAGAPAGGSAVPRGGAREDTRTDAGAGARPGPDGQGRGDRPGQRWARHVPACRDHRDGKNLDPGRRRALEDAAHGARQVQQYCEGILETWDRHTSGHGSGGRAHGSTDRGANGKNDSGKNDNGGADSAVGGDGKDGKDGNGGGGTEDGGPGDRDARDDRDAGDARDARDARGVGTRHGDDGPRDAGDRDGRDPDGGSPDRGSPDRGDRDGGDRDGSDPEGGGRGHTGPGTFRAGAGAAGGGTGDPAAGPSLRAPSLRVRPAGSFPLHASSVPV